MLYRLLADLTAVIHGAFVAYVVLGGLLVFRWPKSAWLHLPAALWGAIIELTGWTCPLTPLEIHFRRLGIDAGYHGGFIEHYLLPALYPEQLTRSIQMLLGVLVAVVNAGIYGWLLSSRRKNKPTL
jgi:hypothetical protein